MSENKMTRRKFLAAAGATATVAATGTFPTAYGQSTNPGPHVEWRNRQPGMAYRRLGRTNLMVSEIVFGGLTVKNNERQWRFLETGIELGINYIDTASDYNKGDSELGIAHVINTPSKRDRVFITTKTSRWNRELRPEIYDHIWESLSVREKGLVRAEIGSRMKEQGVLEEYYLCNYGDWQVTEAEKFYRDDVLEEWYHQQVSTEDRRGMTRQIIEELEGSLKRLGTDHVDMLMGVHGATHPVQLLTPELLEAAETLKRQGKIRFFGTSAHNDPAAITRAAAAAKEYDMAMVAYNISNEPWMTPALEEAARKDLGIIAMKVARAPFPGRGGKVEPLAGLEEKMHKLVKGDLHIAQKAYLWALQNPNIAACVSAMTNDEMTRANAGLAGRKVTLGA